MKKILIAFSALCLAFSCKEKKQNTENSPQQNTETAHTEAKKEQPLTAFTKNADDAYTFAFNLEKNKTYPFIIKTHGKSVQSDGKNSESMSQESITSLDYTVKQVKDSSYIMEVKFTRFKEVMDGPNGKISYDTETEKPKNQVVSQQWELSKAIVGKTFNMEISKKGKVLDITGLLPVQNQIKDSIKTVSLQQINQILSLEALQAMFLESTSYYPQKPIKIKETWTKKEENGNASSTMNYTFKGLDGGEATITITGNSNGKDSQKNPQGVAIYRSLEGNVSGEVKIDQKSGWIKALAIDKKEVVRVTQQYQGQKANFSSTTMTNTTINK